MINAPPARRTWPPSAYQGQVVALTGAAGELGAALIPGLVGIGATVVAVDRTAGSTVGVEWEEADLSREDDVEALFRRVGERHGQIALLVNNAGGGAPLPLARLDAEAIRATLDANLVSAMLCTRAAAPLLAAAEGGAVVNMSSTAARTMSLRLSAAYSAAKAALIGYTRHAAFELAPDGVRVSALCPGSVLTPGVERLLGRDRVTAVAASLPLGRWVTPDDVLAATLFLGSPAASAVTGAALDLDAGALVANGITRARYYELQEL